MRACFMLARVCTPSSTVRDIYKESEGERENEIERKRMRVNERE